MSKESEKAIGADVQMMRVRIVQSQAGGTDWGQIMQGLSGHFQDFGLYPKRDRMSLGIEVVAQQYQTCILRSLAVWRKD